MHLRRIHLPLAGSLLAAGLVLTAVPPAYAAADGCAPGMRSDFNGDGRSDTVVADPFATVSGLSQAGRVIVLYGDADGRIGEGARGQIRQGAANSSTARPGGSAPGRHPGR